MSNKIFNLKSFEGFLSMSSHSFDHNDEADFLLSNINSPKHSFKSNTLLQKYEGWLCENPLYKFPNENSHWDSPLDTSQEILKLLNQDKHTHSNNYKFDLDRDKSDNFADITKSLEKLKFTETNHKLNETNHKLNDPMGKYNENIHKMSENMGKYNENMGKYNENMGKYNENMGKYNENMGKMKDSVKYENMIGGRIFGFEESVERGEDFSAYITEGTGTILKIIEASQLWLKHTSSEKIPLKIKKQFTKNDNFVVLIKKQYTH